MANANTGKPKTLRTKGNGPSAVRTGAWRVSSLRSYCWLCTCWLAAIERLLLVMTMMTTRIWFVFRIVQQRRDIASIVQLDTRCCKHYPQTPTEKPNKLANFVFIYFIPSFEIILTFLSFFSVSVFSWREFPFLFQMWVTVQLQCACQQCSFRGSVSWH